MRRLIVLEPAAYEKLTLQHKQKPEEKILSTLDKKMQDILGLKIPAHEKMQLHNEALQKSQLYERKTRRKEGVKEKSLSQSEILKVYKKTAKPRKILKSLHENKNSFWNASGNLIVDDQVMPSSDIRKLLRSAVGKRNTTLPGWKEFNSLSRWESV